MRPMVVPCGNIAARWWTILPPWLALIATLPSTKISSSSPPWMLILVSLNARTGEVTWERQVGDWTVGQHYSGGPQVFDGKIITGMSGCYYINTGCWITAHDADTGEELWRTNTVPKIGEPGGETWGDLPNELRRGARRGCRPVMMPSST